MSSSRDDLGFLRGLANQLGRLLPAVGGPSSEDIANMSPEEYAKYQEDLAGAKERGQPKMRRIVGNMAKGFQSVNPDTGEVEFFAKDPMKMNRPELVDELVGLPSWFGEALGRDMSDWPQSQEANRHTEQVQDYMQENMDFPPASNPEEYFLDAGGSMGGQLPMPGGWLKGLKYPFRAAGEYARGVLGPVLGRAVQAATLVPRAGIEFFSPTIEPGLKQYLMGTGFGGELQTVLGDKDANEFSALKWKLDHGEVDPIEAETRLSLLLEKLMKKRPGDVTIDDGEDVKPPEPDDSLPDYLGPNLDLPPQGHAKGGKISIEGLRDAVKEYNESFAPQYGMFSTLRKLIETAPFEQAPVEQWRNYLKPGRAFTREGVNFPLKKEELDYLLTPGLGLPETDAQNFQGPMDKQTLLDVIRQTGPKFSLNWQPDLPTTASWSQKFTTPQLEKLIGPQSTQRAGGYSQRNQMSPRADNVVFSDNTPTRLSFSPAQYGPESAWGQRLSHQSPGSDYEESITRLNNLQADMMQHFTPDTLSWSRTSQHEVPDVGKVRLIEEIQSDLHEAAAEKQGGSRTDLMTPEEMDQYRKANDALDQFEHGYGLRAGETIHGFSSYDEARAAKNHLDDLFRKRQPRRGYISQAEKDELNSLHKEWQRANRNPAYNMTDEELDRYQELKDERNYMDNTGETMDREWDFESQAFKDRENAIRDEMDKLEAQAAKRVGWTDEKEARYNQLLPKINAVVDAPFKGPGDYGTLELKKQLLNAANNDEDYLALVRGADQNDRYSLTHEYADRGEGMKYVYDKVYRGAMEKLAKQFGAETTEVHMPVKTAQADVRGDTMQHAGLENGNDVFRHITGVDYESQEKPVHFLRGIAQSVLTDLEADPFVRDNQMELVKKLKKKLDAIPKDEETAGARVRYDPEMAAQVEDFALHLRELTDLQMEYAQKSALTMKTFPAIKLTPEVRERIKKAGVSLFTGAGAAEMLNNEETPEPGEDKIEAPNEESPMKYAKGGKVDLKRLLNEAVEWYKKFAVVPKNDYPTQARIYDEIMNRLEEHSRQTGTSLDDTLDAFEMMKGDPNPLFGPRDVPPTAHAKGGKIDLMELRKAISGMLKETPPVEGSGKELAPVPPAEPQLPAVPGDVPTLKDLQDLADTGPTKPQGTVSRRDILRGALAAMNPVKLDVGKLLAPSLDLPPALSKVSAETAAPVSKAISINPDEFVDFMHRSARDYAEGSGYWWAQMLRDAAEESDPDIVYPHTDTFGNAGERFTQMMKEHGVWQDENGTIHYDPEGAKHILNESGRVSQWYDMADLERKYRLKHGEDNPWETYDLGGDDDVDYHGGYVENMMDALEAYRHYHETGDWPRFAPEYLDWKDKTRWLDSHWGQFLHGDPEDGPEGAQVMALVRQHLSPERRQELSGLLRQYQDIVDSPVGSYHHGNATLRHELSKQMEPIRDELKLRAFGPEPPGGPVKHPPFQWPEPEFATQVGELERWVHVSPEHDGPNQKDIERDFGPIPPEIQLLRDRTRDAYFEASDGWHHGGPNPKWAEYQDLKEQYDEAVLNWMDSLGGKLKPLEKDDAE